MSEWPSPLKSCRLSLVPSVTFSAAETAEILPATSVCVAVMVLTLAASAVAAVIDHAPPITVPVPIVVVPSRSLTVAFSSP